MITAIYWTCLNTFLESSGVLKKNDLLNKFFMMLFYFVPFSSHMNWNYCIKSLVYLPPVTFSIFSIKHQIRIALCCWGQGRTQMLRFFCRTSVQLNWLLIVVETTAWFPCNNYFEVNGDFGFQYIF